jgi:hypothetical protein
MTWRCLKNELRPNPKEAFEDEIKTKMLKRKVEIKM